MARRLAARRLTLDVTPDAREWLAIGGFDPLYGARPLRRLIQSAIGDQLARELLAGRIRDGQTVLVDVNDDDPGALVVRPGGLPGHRRRHRLSSLSRQPGAVSRDSISVCRVWRKAGMSAPAARSMSSVSRSPCSEISASSVGTGRGEFHGAAAAVGRVGAPPDVAGRFQVGDGAADRLLGDVLVAGQFPLAHRAAGHRGQHDHPGVTHPVIAQSGVPGLLDEPGGGRQ